MAGPGIPVRRAIWHHKGGVVQPTLKKDLGALEHAPVAERNSTFLWMCVASGCSCVSPALVHVHTCAALCEDWNFAQNGLVLRVSEALHLQRHWQRTGAHRRDFEWRYRLNTPGER